MKSTADKDAQEGVTDGNQNDTVTDDKSGDKPKSQKKSENKAQRKTRVLLGLEIPEEDIAAAAAESETPVRASRRLAQLRIKKEADQTLIEEMAKAQLENEKKKHKKKTDVDDTSDKKKRKKKHESEDDEEMKVGRY